MKFAIRCAASAVALCSFSALSFAADAPSEWSGRVADALGKSHYRVAEKISDLLFDAVDDIDLLDGSSENFSYGLDVQRRVFDNHDVANTYTVADKIRLHTSIPLASKDLLENASDAVKDAVTSFGISLGTSQGLELLNLRQVRGSKLPSLISVDEVRKRLNAAAALPITIESSEEGAPRDPNAPNESAIESLGFFDPLRKARYGNFWNLFSFPARLPLTPESFAKLEAGEILSYNLTGSVQVGASIGWSADISGIFEELAGSIGYSVYLRGDYRVAVMREDETHARVKLTRAWTQGRNFGLNAETDETRWFDGFVIAGQSLGNLDFYIIPFRVQADRSNSRAFDVGYRYDLTQPEARDAYQLAVLGRFAYSEQLAAAAKGVEKIFTREQKISAKNLKHTVNYAKIWRHSRTSTFTNWDAEVRLPDGTRKIVSSDTQNSREWRLVWGTSEKSTYSFRTNLDLDRYRSGHDDAFYLVAEATIEDSDTNGKEMREYELQVESAVGESEIFPRLPIYAPEQAEPAPGPIPQPRPQLLLNYGRSNFHFRMIFSQEQVERFIDYPEERMWEALEKAFEMKPGSWSSPAARLFDRVLNGPGTVANVPLGMVNAEFYGAPKLFHAGMIRDEWLAIRAETDLRARVQALGHMFRDRLYSRELVSLLRVALEGESIAYVTSATNSAFGRVWKQGESNVDFYPLPDRIQREIDFDQIGPRPYGDDSAQITRIRMRTLDPQSHELTFGFSQEPKVIYVRLHEEGRWSRGVTLGEWVIDSNGKFHVGENLVTVEEAAEAPWAAMAKLIQPGKQYQISMAFSRDGHTWGPLQSTRYFAPGYTPASRR